MSLVFREYHFYNTNQKIVEADKMLKEYQKEYAGLDQNGISKKSYEVFDHVANTTWLIKEICNENNPDKIQQVGRAMAVEFHKMMANAETWSEEHRKDTQGSFSYDLSDRLMKEVVSWHDELDADTDETDEVAAPRMIQEAVKNAQAALRKEKFGKSLLGRSINWIRSWCKQ